MSRTPLATLLRGGQSTGLRIRVARRWHQRALGLLATPHLDFPVGLWIEPCNSVHMFGMRFAIDAVFLDAGGKVLRIVPQLRPWRMAGCRGARTVLELRAGLAAELNLRADDLLDLV